MEIEETDIGRKENVSQLNAKTLTLHWHEGGAAIYSICSQPGEPGKRSERLVTGGGDNNIRIWKVEYNERGDEVAGIEYLSSITKHTQAVNCVRFNASGTLLATASDDGTIMIWERNDTIVREFGQDADDDIKESWVVKVACFASNMSEIYDICWSPDSKYICCGLMDNIIRIFSVATGSMMKQIAEHSHYVQGVAWDPLGEYICSQSADRSVHVYKISHSPETGELNVGPTAFYRSVKGEVPVIKLSHLDAAHDADVGSGDASDGMPSASVTAPTPTRVSTPASSSTTTCPTPVMGGVADAHAGTNVNTTMQPPMQAPRHKRTYSNSSSGSAHGAVGRCLSPLPLPAVMPSSPGNLHLGLSAVSAMSQPSLPAARLADESPATAQSGQSAHPIDGKAAGQPGNTGDDDQTRPQGPQRSPELAYKTQHLYHNETLQSFFRRLAFSPDGALLVTTCGIYRGKEVENTVYVYTRGGLSANRGPVVHLPGMKRPAISVRFSPLRYELLADPHDSQPANVFGLPYRMLFAVATQDSVAVYDTQRLRCVAVVTNIHYASITDITWSGDGRSIFVAAGDGFVSCMVLGLQLVGKFQGAFPAGPPSAKRKCP